MALSFWAHRTCESFLCSSLPDVVLEGKVPATVRKYSAAFLQWKLWEKKKEEVCLFPASKFLVSLLVKPTFNLEGILYCTGRASCVCLAMGQLNDWTQ